MYVCVVCITITISEKKIIKTNQKIKNIKKTQEDRNHCLPSSTQKNLAPKRPIGNIPVMRVRKSAKGREKDRGNV